MTPLARILLFAAMLLAVFLVSALAARTLVPDSVVQKWEQDVEHNEHN